VASGILIVGLFFAPLAGAMAYLVTYEEYRHHGFDARSLVWRSLQAGVAACLFFACGAIALSVILPRVFGISG